MLATTASSSKANETAIAPGLPPDERLTSSITADPPINSKSVQYMYNIVVYSNCLGSTIQDRRFGRLCPY